MDTNFHENIDLATNTTSPKNKENIIGRHVWIGTRSMILKGSYIPDGCIIGASSVVNKKYNEDNSLIAENPTIIKKKNITLK